MSARKFDWQRALKEPGHGLTPTELLVVHTLALWADSSGRAYPPVPTIAAAGLGVRTVQKALARAEVLGWVEAPDDRPGAPEGAPCGGSSRFRPPSPETPLLLRTPMPLPSPETPLPPSGETPPPPSPGTDEEVTGRDQGK